jgi:hypothetical protein
MYFSNSESYKSATSGVLTILIAIVLVIFIYIIFVPIFRKNMYTSDFREIKIRGVYENGTVDDCTSCRNFTVQQELEHLFNGKQMLLIYSSG